MTHPPFTVRSAIHLGAICEAAIGTKTVARLMPDLNNIIVIGTARCIGDERGNFAGPNDDIRDLFLRVTTRGGFEAFWPVSDLMGEIQTGYFVVDYQE